MKLHIKKIKHFFERINIHKQDLFLLICVVLVNCSLVFSLVKNNSISSFFFYLLSLVIALWFFITFITHLIKWFKGDLKDTTKRVILCLFIILVVYLVVEVVLNGVLNHMNILSIDYLRKALLYITSASFLFCCLLSRFNKILIYITGFISIVFISLVLLLFVAGPARTWYGYASWHNLTLNYSNPNFAALVLFSHGLIICTLFAALNSRFGKIVCLLTLLFIAFFIYLTSCRSVIVAAFVAFGFYFLLSFLKSKQPIKLVIVLFPILFAFVYIFISYLVQKTTADNIQVTIYGTISGKSMGTRITIWLLGFKDILRHPFLGNYSETFFSQYHNTYVDAWVTFGIIPLCIFIYLFYQSIHLCSKGMKHSFKKMNLICLLCSLMTMFGETSVLHSGMGTAVLCLVFIAFANTDFENYEDVVLIDDGIKHCDVLIITSVYEIGSIGKMVHGIYEKCKDEQMSTCVLYGRGSDSDKYDGHIFKMCSEIEAIISKLMGKITGRIYSFNLFSTFRVIRFIKKTKPYVVNIHSINDNYINPYILFKYLNNTDIDVIYTAHSGNLIFANCGGNSFDCSQWKNDGECKMCPRHPDANLPHNLWNKMNYALKDNNRFEIVAVSNYLKELLSLCPYLKNKKISTIYNGLELPSINSVVHKRGSGVRKQILFVIPSIYNPNKGYSFFEQIAKKYPHFNFVCVSFDQSKPKTDCPNIKYAGPVLENEKMTSYYAESDLTLVLSKSETFCLPVAESLLCGTPVVGFKSGGPEEIAIKEYCTFVDYSNMADLFKAIEKTLDSNFNKDEISAKAKLKYSIESMNSKYFELYCSKITTHPRVVDYYSISI